MGKIKKLVIRIRTNIEMSDDSIIHPLNEILLFEIIVNNTITQIVVVQIEASFKDATCIKTGIEHKAKPANVETNKP